MHGRRAGFAGYRVPQALAALLLAATAACDDRATIRIVTQPGGAAISVDGNAAGTSPADGQPLDIRVEPGQRKLQANLRYDDLFEGHWDGSIAAAAGKTHDVKAELFPRPQPAFGTWRPVSLPDSAEPLVAAHPDQGIVFAAGSHRIVDKGGITIVHADPSRREIWRRRIESPSRIELKALGALPGRRFLAAGETRHTEGRLAVRIWLAVVNADGTVAWEKTLGAPANEMEFGSAAAAPEGGVLVAGRRDGFAWFARLGADGALRWEKDLSGTQPAIRALPEFLLRAESGTATAIGVRALGSDGRPREPAFGHEVFALEIADVGGAIAHRALITAPPHRFTGTLRVNGRDVALRDSPTRLSVRGAGAAANGDTIVATTGWIGPESAGLRLSRFGADGTEKWRKVVKDHAGHAALAMTVLPQGDIVVAGAIDNPRTRRPNGWLIRLDGEGRVRGDHTADSLRTLAFRRIAPWRDGVLVEGGAGTGEATWLVQLERLPAARP